MLETLLTIVKEIKTMPEGNGVNQMMLVCICALAVVFGVVFVLSR